MRGEEGGSVIFEIRLVEDESGGLSLSFNQTVHELQRHSKPQIFPPTVLFTGFKTADRTRLESLATTSGFTIRKSVSHELTIVVAGYNAGPAKLAGARQEGATVLTEPEFIKLIETGELPLRPTTP